MSNPLLTRLLLNHFICSVTISTFEVTHLYGRLFIPLLYQQKSHLDPEAYPARASAGAQVLALTITR